MARRNRGYTDRGTNPRPRRRKLYAPKLTPYQYSPATRAGATKIYGTTFPTVTPTVTPTVPSGGGGGGGPHYPGWMSPSQIRAQALLEAKMALGPQQAEYRLQRAEELKRANARAQAIQGFTTAAAGMMQGAGAQIMGNYQSAARDQTTFAKGFSDATRQIAEQNAGQQNAHLAALGNTSQTVAGDTGASNVLYGLGGYIPATTLEREGAAWSAAASAYPRATLGEGANAFRSVLAQGEETAKGYDARLKNLAAQQGQIVAKYIQSEKQRQYALQTNAITQKQNAEWQAKNLRLKEQALAFNNLLAAKQFGLKVEDLKLKEGALTLREKDLSLKTQNQVFTQKVTLSKLEQANMTLKLQAARDDNNVRIALANLGVTQDAEQRKAIELQWKMDHPNKKKGGFTQAQLTSLRTRANKMARVYANGGTLVEKHPDENGVMRSGEYAYTSGQKTYAQAFQDMLDEGIPPRMAQNFLNRYYRPDPAGRTSSYPPGARKPLKINWNTLGSVPNPTKPDSAQPPTRSANGYVNPAPAAKVMKVDSGVDFQGTPGGTVRSIGDAVVTNVRTVAGFGKMVTYKLLSGPAAGRYIFVGHAEPTVRVGQKLAAGAPVARLKQHAYGLRQTSAHSPGWVEMGFAAGPGGMPQAYADLGTGWSGPVGDPPTKRGQEFLALLRSEGLL